MGLRRIGVSSRGRMVRYNLVQLHVIGTTYESHVPISG